MGTYTWSIQTENVAFKNATSIDATGGTDIDVMFNVAGMELATGTSAFSAPQRLSASSCGVERWDNVAQTCGFADFNGDGLADRFENGYAFLTTGSLSGSFFSNQALIPVGVLASHNNPQYSTCNSGTDAYSSVQDLPHVRAVDFVTSTATVFSTTSTQTMRSPGGVRNRRWLWPGANDRHARCAFAVIGRDRELWRHALGHGGRTV